MKHIYGIMAALALLTTSCGGKQKATVEEEQQRVLQIDSVDTQSGLQRMKTSQYDEDVKLGTHSFHLSITRQPDDQAATVRSEVGTFADNQVTLRITRDGAQWVTRTLHKTDFAAYAGGEAYARHFILEGMVYDEDRTLSEKQPVFAASICVPLSDLYIPFVVRVTAAGDVQISRDEDMDVLPNLEEEKE